MIDEPITVVAIVKGHESYSFFYSEENRNEVLRQCGRFAVNPELSFGWYDAAIISQKIREASK